MSNPTRRELLMVAQALEGVTYIIGGDGLERSTPTGFIRLPVLGLDCSGFIGYCLKCAGGEDLRRTYSSATYASLPVVEQPKPGDVAVYPHHVMMVVGDGRVLGACGGDSKTDTFWKALEKGARVQYRSRPEYRQDFLGFRSMHQFLKEDANA